MIESPIKRKLFQYPKDFTRNHNQQKEIRTKYSFKQEYSIQTNPTKNQSDLLSQNQEKQISKEFSQLNPQKITITNSAVEQEKPLNHHLCRDRPNIPEEALKNPRFAVADKQIAQNNDFQLEASASPGTIRKQLGCKQVPLPEEDPCQIQLLKTSKSFSNKFRQNIIKFSAHGNYGTKRWTSNERDVIQKFNEDKEKNKSARELPSILKPEEKVNIKQHYQSIKKKQQHFSEGFGKMNNLLLNLKHRQSSESRNVQDPPAFQPRAVKRLKQEISEITQKNKFRRSDIFDNDSSQEPQSEHDAIDGDEEHQTNHFRYSQREIQKRSKPKKLKQKNLIVSYRTSLSDLKHLSEQKDVQKHIIIRIPKLFGEDLIYKDQPKSELYTMAKGIFSQLKIPHDHLIIKRYSNCTLMVSKNICMIWHFNGKRYLGGWQTQYLDEGFKHGLGLQWEPTKYVYYGEFVKNKKEGIGIYKDCHEDIYFGHWIKGEKSFNYESKANSMYHQKLRRKENAFAEFGNDRSSSYQPQFHQFD